MKLRKILTASLATLLLASAGATTSNVNAKRYHRHARTHRVYRRRPRRRARRYISHTVVPARYQHDYYGGRHGNRMEYKLHGNYAYFTDNIRAHHARHWIRYQLRRGHHGEILTINNNYMPTPFKLRGNHIRIMYDVTPMNLYR